MPDRAQFHFNIVNEEKHFIIFREREERRERLAV